MGHFICRISLLLMLLSQATAFAQSNDNEFGSPAEQQAIYEVGVEIGDLLPNQITGVTEMMGVGGVRGGFRISPLVYAEAGAIFGNGNMVEWKNLHVDIRLDIPVENLVGFAYVGGDSIYYRGDDSDAHLIFGGHVGGGFQFALTEVLWFRGDMKFNVSPGTSLYIGAGFSFRFGG